MVSPRAQLSVSADSPPRSLLNRMIEFPAMRQWSSKNYRDEVRECYDGPAGAVLRLGSLLSLHEPLVGRMFETRRFDIAGRKSILDIGSGAGQILRHLVRMADDDAGIVAVDLSTQMLVRARKRIGSARPTYVTADMTQLPFPDDSFDCITCGWVMEYQLDPRPALQEMQRVLQPGGSLFVLATEDCLSGALISRTWKCRTFSREELRLACIDTGLHWHEQFWLTPLHKALRAGGIIFEARKSGV